MHRKRMWIPMLLLLSGCAEPGFVDRKVTSFDGTQLDVRVFPAAGKDRSQIRESPTVVIFHGWLTDKNIYRGLSEDLCRAGWNVVAFDQRNHGRSDKTPTTWGAKEKRDAKIVVDEMIRLGLISDKLHSFGGSMGGCIAIQYAAFDPRVRSCFAVVPVNGLRGAKRSMLPLARPETIERIVSAEAKRLGYDPEDASPERAIQTFTGPVLIVGGKFDIIVPARQCREIFAAANEPKEYIELPVGHLLAVKYSRRWLMDKLEQLRQQADAMRERR
jgi:pimeloyl-ACP methyl ester carboxylesterase